MSGTGNKMFDLMLEKNDEAVELRAKVAELEAERDTALSKAEAWLERMNTLEADRKAWEQMRQEKNAEIVNLEAENKRLEERQYSWGRNRIAELEEELRCCKIQRDLAWDQLAIILESNKVAPE